MSGNSLRNASRPFIRCAAAILLLELVAGSGCSTGLPSFVRQPRIAWGGWIAGYEEAVAAAKKSSQGLLVFYRTTNVGVADPMHDAVQAGLSDAKTVDRVRCFVFASHEPDRRFVRQYGVQRAPALIVIHPDGTFHAAEGPRSTEQVTQFLDSAQPPGATPTQDALLPCEVTYDWHHSFESAQSASANSGQSIFVALDRWMTRDWSKLGPMVECRDVHSRVADMVHCRPNAGLWSGVDATCQRFGVANLPAVVVVRPDGSRQTLELPASSDAIARFLDSARATRKTED